jgi:hypothetical protein
MSSPQGYCFDGGVPLMLHEAVIRITGFQLHSGGFFPVLLFFVGGDDWRHHTPRLSMFGFITFLEEKEDS